MTRRPRSAVLVRFSIAAACGVVVGFAVAPFLGLAVGLVAGWTVLALTSVIWVLVVVWRFDAARTKAYATAEDPGRPAARLIAVIGSIASLGGVALVLIESKNASDVQAFVNAAIVVAAVASSWALIQVDYMLRVAHEYYSAPVGGIDFHQDEDPMYTDFAYFSVGLGMTYQVADTNVTSSAIRRIVIAQTMLAYLFGAIILATIINLVSNLA